MRKIKLLAVLCMISISLFAQVPSKFNYQAVIRNSSGDLIKNQSVTVQVSILDNSATGTVVYREQHTGSTNNYGLINLLIGNGTPNLGTFSTINWSSLTKFIKIEVNTGSGLVNMGTSQLLSVPFALYAGATAKLGGGGVYSTDSDTLFVVKDHSGNPVFVVFADGAKVLLNDAAKGSVGGFAVSGRTSGKAIESAIMQVTPDSTRIYVNEVPKGKVGGFAVSGRNSTKTDASSFLSLTPQNYFIGHEAGINTTTGLYNSFFGYQSGYYNTEGNYNVFMGRQTGYYNTTGYSNVLIGDQTGAFNTTGYANVFIGDGSGYSNDDGYWNIFLGRRSGASNESGSANIIIGDYAGYDNTTGYDNVIIGDWAGANNTEGYENIFAGKEAGWNNTTGYKNIFIGGYSGYTNTTGNWNVFMGEKTGYYSTSGVSNVFLGQSAGYNNQTGSYNVFLGTLSGYTSTSGAQNVFLGQQAGEYSSSGNYNLYLGAFSGRNNINGNYNVFLGYGAGYYETGSNKLYIENDYNATSSTAFIYGDFSLNQLRMNANVGIWSNPSTTYEFYVNGDAYSTLGWWYSSDKRWKTNINNLEMSLDKVLKLRGVTFDWRVNEFKEKKFEEGRQIGVIAQEVEEVVPELVKTDDQGYKSVDYAKLTPLLIEAIKEQQKLITEQNKKIDGIQKTNEMLKRELENLKTQVEKLKNKDSQSRTAEPKSGN